MKVFHQGFVFSLERARSRQEKHLVMPIKETIIFFCCWKSEWCVAPMHPAPLVNSNVMIILCRPARAMNCFCSLFFVLFPNLNDGVATLRYDLLFQCNTLEREPRGEIFRLMTQKTSGPVPVNRAPLEPKEMVIAAAKGIFAVSPPGTGEKFLNSPLF